MIRLGKIFLIFIVTLIMVLGPMGCGKKGPPIPKNPFAGEVRK